MAAEAARAARSMVARQRRGAKEEPQEAGCYAVTVLRCYGRRAEVTIGVLAPAVDSRVEEAAAPLREAGPHRDFCSPDLVRAAPGRHVVHGCRAVFSSSDACCSRKINTATHTAACAPENNGCHGEPDRLNRVDISRVLGIATVSVATHLRAIDAETISQSSNVPCAGLLTGGHLRRPVQASDPP